MANPSEACPYLIQLLSKNDNYTAANGKISLDRISTLEETKMILTNYINPILCVFGIIGNCLNVFVLTRKKFQSTLNCNHERVAAIGLIMLALSDMLYCISAFPECTTPKGKTMSEHLDFPFLYQLYGSGVKAYFTYTSNWLTVLTAVSRYLAICRPLRSRGLISNRSVVIAVIFICVFWALFILPTFWTNDLQRIDCPDDNISVYLQSNGYFVRNKYLKVTFSYLWIVFGSLVPMVMLMYCNYHLIKTVRESARMRQLYRVHSKNRNTGSNITITLVGIICMFIICTLPSDILTMFYYNVNSEYVEQVMTAIVIANVLLTLNYSMNFLLYCFVNPRFRQTINDIIQCRKFSDIKRQMSFTTHINGSRHKHSPPMTDNISNYNMSDSSTQPGVKDESLLKKTDLSTNN